MLKRTSLEKNTHTQKIQSTHECRWSLKMCERLHPEEQKKDFHLDNNDNTCAILTSAVLPWAADGRCQAVYILYISPWYLLSLLAVPIHIFFLLSQHSGFSHFYEMCVIIKHQEPNSCVSPLPSFLVPGWLCSVTSSVTRVALRLSICSINGVFSLLHSDLSAWHRLPGVPLCVKSPPSVCHATELPPPPSGFVVLLQ